MADDFSSFAAQFGGKPVAESENDGFAAFAKKFGGVPTGGASSNDEANRALSGTGLSVSPPKGPALPSGLSPDQYVSPWKDPTQGLIGQGVRQVGRGIAGLTREGLDPKLEAASDIVGGAGKIAAPAVIGATFPALAANPVGTVAGVAAGAAGAAALGKGGAAAAKALGAGPGLQSLTEQAGEVVGGVGGYKVGSKLPPNIMKVDPRIAINRGLRPPPSDPNFPDRIPQTLANVKQANPGYKPAVENGKLNLGPATQKAIKIQQEALEPWMERAKGTTVSGAPIVQATAEATKGMLPSESESARALIARAQQDYGMEFTPEQLRDRLSLLNDRLSPFYNQSPNKQSAALADIPEAVLKAQRDAVADTLYRHLDPEGEGAGPRLIQKQTGDLIHLRDSAARRQNAIVAEQPLTPLGKVVDPIKGAVRGMLPGKATGAGIAFAEGSEGRSLPMVRRAFKAVGNEPVNALPKPASPLYPRVNANRQLPAGPAVQMPGGGSPPIPDDSGITITTGPRVQNPARQLPPASIRMGAVPDGSGDRSWTGPVGPPPPFRQLEGGPQPAPARQGNAMPVQPPVESKGQIIPAHKVVDPKTGKIYYTSAPETDVVKPFAKGGVVIPADHEDKPAPFAGARSGEDIIRGSSNIPLSPDGIAQAKKIGQDFKRKGGLDKVVTSDLDRARRTAGEISAAGAAPPARPTKNLHPWHLGEIEGQPTKQVIDDMNRYITKKPNQVVPGRGSNSSEPGEAFNTFKRRALGEVTKLLGELKSNPNAKIGAVTHFRVLKLIESWLKRGAPPSMEIDANHMIKKGDPPGTVMRLHLKGEKPALDKVDMASPDKLKGGVYIVRHGRTFWNGEEKTPAGETPQPFAKPVNKSGRLSARGNWYGPPGTIKSQSGSSKA